LVNYSPEGRTVNLNVADGWKFGKVLYGEFPEKTAVKLKSNDASVLLLKKE